MQRDSLSTRSLAIVVHDVSPATHELTQRLTSLVSSIDSSAPLTLLVVPIHHGKVAVTEQSAWRKWMDARVANGDEIALHGLRHRDEGQTPTNLNAWFARRVLTDGEAEFAAIGYEDARQRIETGLKLLQRCGWQARGFVPPAWQMNIATRAVLADFPFEYTSTRTNVYELPTWRAAEIDSFGFSVRASWRRMLSKHWNLLKLQLAHSEPTLRVALHPADALYPEAMATWRHLLQELLSDRVAVTKSHLLTHRHGLGRTAGLALARGSLQARGVR
jgi:predicted deacetylase